MPAKTSFETSSLVIALRDQGFTYPKISESLASQGFSLSRRTVLKICQEKEKERNGWTNLAKRLPPQNLPSACTQDNVNKVKKAVVKKNPDSLQKIAKKLQVSIRSVGRMIHQNLGLEVRKKRKLHDLTEAQKKQRYERGKLFISYLGPFKVRHIFTMDETWISLDDCNVDTDHFWTDGSAEIPEEWKKKTTKRWPKKVMIAIGICWFGMSRAYVVNGSAKVTAQYFIDEILSKMIHEDIPRLYGNSAKDVIFRMDSAPSHTAKLTIQHLKDHRVKYIPKEIWMANSPDLARLDYGINGNLKRILSERKATTIKGLISVIKKVCESYDIAEIRSTLSSWQGRVQTMLDRHGGHVEVK
ncbi:hypothetical protein RvY_14478-1 [Ramazzottius varieornatus]|uniref:Tc1-like transposase DDE domain-containing protein n=1 Tax=Ramazzottius varieornatus TaxID=947166 RepID=A0A1D1VWI6_RAMVA|nr:hypothetical protein RvY_14478-1 [Ramazzottius varieornatus]